MTVKNQALEVANKYLENVNNTGKFGIHADVMVRAYVQGVVHKLHPAKVADTIAHNCTIEIKTGGHWTTPYNLPQEKAIQCLASGSLYGKNRFVAYCPDYLPTNDIGKQFHICTRKKFIKLMSIYKGQFTVSKYSELGYGVKFQSLNSNKRSNFVWEVWEQMESLESWTKRLNIETYKEQG